MGFRISQSLSQDLGLQASIVSLKLQFPTINSANNIYHASTGGDLIMYDKGLDHKTFVMVVIFVAVFFNYRVSWFIYVAHKSNRADTKAEAPSLLAI